jgi:hypothetical protein
MSLQEYHAQQRANDAENRAREVRERAALAGRWIGSIPDLLARIEALETRVQELERRATPEAREEEP